MLAVHPSVNRVSRGLSVGTAGPGLVKRSTGVGVSQSFGTVPTVVRSGVPRMTDQIEEVLSEISGRLRTAWQNSQCRTCPLGELAALAAATLTFYQEQRKAAQQGKSDHWTNYRQQ